MPWFIVDLQDVSGARKRSHSTAKRSKPEPGNFACQEFLTCHWHLCRLSFTGLRPLWSYRAVNTLTAQSAQLRWRLWIAIHSMLSEVQDFKTVRRDRHPWRPIHTCVWACTYVYVCIFIHTYKMNSPSWNTNVGSDSSFWNHQSECLWHCIIIHFKINTQTNSENPGQDKKKFFSFGVMIGITA